MLGLSVRQFVAHDFDLKFLYLEVTAAGNGIRYQGDRGLYDSGPNQIDPALARFVPGRFTRTAGRDEVWLTVISTIRPTCFEACALG